MALDAAKCLSPGGALLVVEPALLSTSRDALELRDGLVARGWSVAAPCPGRSRLPCPALSAGPGHTCHDELRWETPGTVRQLAERTGLDKESQATWFAATRPRKDHGRTTSRTSPIRRIFSGWCRSAPEQGGRIGTICRKGGRILFRRRDDPAHRSRASPTSARGRRPRGGPRDTGERLGLAPDTRIDVLNIRGPEAQGRVVAPTRKELGAGFRKIERHV